MVVSFLRWMRSVPGRIRRHAEPRAIGGCGSCEERDVPVPWLRLSALQPVSLLLTSHVTQKDSRRVVGVPAERANARGGDQVVGRDWLEVPKGCVPAMWHCSFRLDRQGDGHAALRRGENWTPPKGAVTSVSCRSPDAHHLPVPHPDAVIGSPVVIRPSLSAISHPDDLSFGCGAGAMLCDAVHILSAKGPNCPLCMHLPAHLRVPPVLSRGPQATSARLSSHKGPYLEVQHRKGGTPYSCIHRQYVRRSGWISTLEVRQLS